jgi:hypothetical protein
MRQALATLLLAACSGTSAGGATTSEPLCNGGMTARLTYLVGGGQVDQDYAFHSAYGFRSFVVDGACNFWVAREPLQGLGTGHLGPEQAAEFAAKLHWAALPELSKQRDVDSCPDAGDSVIGDGVHTINCTCGCDGLPAGTREAFARVEEVHRSLTAMSAPSEGPLRAATRPVPPDEQKIPGSSPAPLDWTLPFHPMELAIAEPSASRDSGKAIDDAAQRAELRRMRAAASQMPRGFGLLVRVADGSIFRLYLRDEAPDHVVAGLAVR